MFSDFGKEIVGLDIGGANLKAAIWPGENEVRGASMNFPMWKQPDRLAEGVQQLLGQLRLPSQSSIQLAVTMTGELADCFASRREGVARIIDQLSLVVSPNRLSIYTVDGRWFSTEQANADPWTVAASNWHALATWLALWPTTSADVACGVLVDIGSTTVDVLPMLNGRLATDARTDRDRLERSQLIYTGIRRTPICAVVTQLWIDDVAVPVMAELFATVDDAYLLLGLVAEDVDDRDSADGRERTQRHAAARLARMIGEDAERLTQNQLASLALQVVQAQANQVASAIAINLQQLNTAHAWPNIIYSGHGLPLFEQTIRTVLISHRDDSHRDSDRDSHRIVRLNELVSDEISRCAPAAAVAWLRKHHH